MEHAVYTEGEFDAEKWARGKYVIYNDGASWGGVKPEPLYQPGDKIILDGKIRHGLYYLRNAERRISENEAGIYSDRRKPEPGPRGDRNPEFYQYRGHRNPDKAERARYAQRRGHGRQADEADADLGEHGIHQKRRWYFIRKYAQGAWSRGSGIAENYIPVTVSSPLKSRLPARGWMPAPSLNWPDAVQRVHDTV